MLSENQRLNKNKDFDNVFQNGKKVFFKGFSIRFLDNNLEINRFGILVSTKVSKKAVDRNKIKRQIRQTLKTEEQSLKTGFDVIISATPKVLFQNNSSLKYNIKKGLERANLYIK